MKRLLLAIRTWDEWLPMIGRLFRDMDVDAFERETRAYRQKYGIS